MRIRPIPNPEAYVLSQERAERQAEQAKALRKIATPLISVMLEYTHHALGGDPIFTQNRVGQHGKIIQVKKLKAYQITYQTRQSCTVYEIHEQAGSLNF